ncbi:DUF1330 domain-containing protein [Bradyrhizobium erythrophlei]|uniref:DUF1330 domain-containing protein n=1 Tax=Bradyrhizobium erythrophlei TaxID=1437360 RepID=UPI0009F8F5DF
MQRPLLTLAADTLCAGGSREQSPGTPPAGQVIVVQFDSIDNLVAFTESAGFKDSQAPGEKYANIRIFGVEGIPK